MYKFRSMTDARDKNGKLLSDAERLPKFGKLLRATSLDEIPEIVNVLKGDMSLVGPRPQLVRDMVFMNKEQLKRHNVRPGITGLAQVNGRNAINWEIKLSYDLEYTKNITFYEDIKILILTIKKAVIKQEGIIDEGQATAVDFGDYLLQHGKIDKKCYEIKQKKALEKLKNIGKAGKNNG